LGLNGIVVKSHGGTDATGFASAIDLAYDMASNGVVKPLARDVAGFHTKLELEGAARDLGGASYGESIGLDKVRTVIKGRGGELPQRVVTNGEPAKRYDAPD